jgi:hypothetical protein
VKIQIAIDCRDPHALAAFYAAGLGYEVEQHDERIRQLLDSGVLPEDEVTEVDGRLAFRTAAAVTHPTLPRLLFQVVPEAKTVKNRVHVDVHVDGDRGPVVERLLGLGATKRWDGQQGPQTWVTLADPEGNELCIS